MTLILSHCFKAVASMAAVLAVMTLAFSPTSARADDWTLARALARVRDDNPDAKSAGLRIAAAKAKLREARAAFWPKLSGSTGYSATDNPTQAFMYQLNQRQFSFGGGDFNNPDTTDNWHSELRLDYPIYMGGARKAGIDAASQGVVASENDARATIASLEMAVAEAYYRVFQAREIIVAAESTRKSHQSNLDLSKRLVEEKTALETAVLDLEVRVAEAETAIVFARNEAKIRQEYLRNLLGIEKNEPFTVAGGLTSLSAPALAAASERPEVAAARARIEQAVSGKRKAKADYLPVLNAFGVAQRDEGFTERGGGGSWLVGLALRWDFFEGGARKARMNVAAAREGIARQQLRKTRLQHELEITRAELNLKATRKQISFTKKGIESAEKSAELTRKRFEEQLALSTQLIDSQSALTRARVRLAEARANERIAIAALRHALGLPILDSVSSK